MNTAFQERGYSLTPQTYQNVYTPLTATHEPCGTAVTVNYHRLTHGFACPGCSQRPRADIESATAHVAGRGGKVIGFAEHSKKNSTWECKERHKWRASWSSVKNGSWCPYCSGKKSANPGEARAKNSLYHYRRADAKKGFETTITVAEISGAQRSLCNYCDQSASGVDRIDNNIGHASSNCVPCCWRCNFVRGDRVSYEDMLAIGQVFKNKAAK